MVKPDQGDVHQLRGTASIGGGAKTRATLGLGRVGVAVVSHAGREREMDSTDEHRNVSVILYTFRAQGFRLGAAGGRPDQQRAA